MKKPVQELGKLTLLLLSIFLITAACSKDDTPETKNPPPPTDNPDGMVQDSVPESTETLSVDPNKITQSLKFRNGIIITGDLPTGKSAKTATEDLKIDTDTIFWVEGVTNRIKILKPEGLTGIVGTFWGQVEGSDSYIEAEFEKEQENDSIVILNFDFDVTEWDPPFSFNMTFVPTDDKASGDLGRIRIPVLIELPYSGNNCKIVNQSHWDWIYTSLNGEYHTGPMHYSEIQGTIEGCCTNGVSYSGGACFPNNPDRKALNYETAYVVSRDFFKFTVYDSRIDVIGSMKENANNLDPVNIDFCGGSVSYTDSNKGNFFSADVTQSNCTFTLSNMSGQEEEVIDPVTGTSLGSLPLPIYMGSGPLVEYQIISPHFIKEIRNNPDAGPEGVLERVYEKRNTDLMRGAWWFPAI